MQNFSGVYVFGDSLVDPGNTLKAAELVDAIPFQPTPELAPTADKGYFEGRFTDGYTFADLISNKLLSTPTKTTFPYGFEDPVFNIPITIGGRPEGVNLSFAYGGAQAVRGEELFPDLDEQTDAYRTYPSADPNALYIVTIGSSDVHEYVPRTSPPVTGEVVNAKISAAAIEIAEEVAQLYSFGARHVLVSGIPDLGLIPHFLGAADEANRRGLASTYSAQMDAQLQTALDNIQLPAGATLYRFDIRAFGAALVANPTAFALTNVTQARSIVQAGALDPVGSGFLFFDHMHPSAQAHALAAAEILEAFGGAPEGPVAGQAGPRTLAAIEGVGASDDFQVSLVAGQPYVFDVLGLSSGSGALADPKLQILNAAAAVVGGDDDAGLGLDAHLAFTPSESGLYTLRVGGVGVAKGAYVVQGPDVRGSNVQVEGGASNDLIGALSGSNTLRGGDGADSIVGGAGFDAINGNVGADTASGGLGGDWVLGGKDDDQLNGEAGDDIVNGNLGADTCEGGDGADTVRGGQGADSLSGGTGNDFLSGDLGDDAIVGGSGADTFHSFGAANIDRVLDFNLAEGDRVQLDPGTTHTLAQTGADTTISMSGGGQVVLVGVSMSSLTGAWIFGA